MNIKRVMNYCPPFPLIAQRPCFRGDVCQLDGFHEGLHVRLSCPGSALEAFWLHWDDVLEPLGLWHDQRWPRTMTWLRPRRWE